MQIRPLTGSFWLWGSASALTGISLLLGACTGPSGDGSARTAGPAPSSAPGGVDTEGSEAALTAAPASLKRLRLGEYQSSIRALLGDTLTLPSDLDGDLARGGYTTISAAVDPYSSAGIERFEAAGYALAAQVFGGSAADTLVGCRPTSSMDPCVTKFVKDFGRRAWRRPLSDEELAKWTGAVGSVASVFDGDVMKGLEFVVAGLLQSPHFLYRADIGEPVAGAPNLRRYTAYEMASRLSFVLWETTPDDILLDAAGAGELSTPGGVSAHAARMLGDERAKPAMQRFFSEFLRLSDLTTEFHPKDAQLFPNVSDALYASMQTEQQLGIADLFQTGGNVLDLFTSRSVYMDGALADFYGVARPAGPGFSLTPLPKGRVGYLTSGAFLSINAHAASSSPTRRGVYVVQNLMCRVIPPPPPNTNTTLPPDTGATTTRERLKAHRENAACAGCHSLFDPVGLSFEHFDAAGGYRETENGFSIDTTGLLDGVAFDNPEGLAKLLHESNDVARCLVASAYRYNSAHNIEHEADGEGATIDQLLAAFQASGKSYPELVASMVQHPAFRHATGQF